MQLDDHDDGGAVIMLELVNHSVSMCPSIIIGIQQCFEWVANK